MIRVDSELLAEVREIARDRREAWLQPHVASAAHWTGMFDLYRESLLRAGGVLGPTSDFATFDRHVREHQQAHRIPPPSRPIDRLGPLVAGALEAQGYDPEDVRRQINESIPESSAD